MEHIVETLVHIFSGVIPAELTVFALSFYLGLGKRRNELKKTRDSGGSTRKVLQ